MFKQSFINKVVPGVLVLGTLGVVNEIVAQDVPAGDADRGQKYFQLACAVCHTPALGAGNTIVIKQGPTLVGVLGRPAATSPHFNYSKALKGSGLTWDGPTLYRFLANPMTVVPGTVMPMPVPDAGNRAD